MMTATARKLDAAALLAGTTPNVGASWTAEDYVILRDVNSTMPVEYGWCVKCGDDTVCDVYTVNAEETARLIAAAPDLAARVLELEAALRSMTHLLDRIHAADASGNNGAVMGEAHLCRYFAVGAEQELAAARALLGATP